MRSLIFAVPSKDIDQLFAEGNSRSLNDYRKRLDAILLISEKHAHVFDQNLGEVRKLALDQADFNAQGACSVSFKNQIIMIGGAQNGSRVALFKGKCF